MFERKDHNEGEIVFGCDNCTETYDTEDTDFPTALRRVKNEGWKVKKESGDWVHYCPNCDPDTARNEFDVVR